MSRLLNIAFMGSGAFAVPVLKTLLLCPEFRICAVITQPDKVAGRKRVLTSTPVGKYCNENKIPCERIPSVNHPDVLKELSRMDLDLIVVVSFGQILKEEILNLPQLGCLNVHASILPKYRGASPIASCIVNGDAESGVSFMQMERGLDSGPVYEIYKIMIDPEDTTCDLEQKLAELAAAKIEACITSIAFGGLQPRAQAEMNFQYAMKITKKDGYVNWNEDAELIARKVRAYANWPSMTCRFVTHAGRMISMKMLTAKASAWRAANAVPGEIIKISEEGIMVACGAGSLMLGKVLPEGKKEMTMTNFRNGTKVEVGDMMLNGDVSDNPESNRKD